MISPSSAVVSTICIRPASLTKYGQLPAAGRGAEQAFEAELPAAFAGFGVAGGQHAGSVGGKDLVSDHDRTGGAGLQTAAAELLGGVGGVGIIKFQGGDAVGGNVQHAVQHGAGGNSRGAVFVAPGVGAVLGADSVDAGLRLQGHEAGFQEHGRGPIGGLGAIQSPAVEAVGFVQAERVGFTVVFHLYH